MDRILTSPPFVYGFDEFESIHDEWPSLCVDGVEEFFGLFETPAAFILHLWRADPVERVQESERLRWVDFERCLIFKGYILNAIDSSRFRHGLSERFSAILREAMSPFPPPNVWFVSIATFTKKDLAEIYSRSRFEVRSIAEKAVLGS